MAGKVVENLVQGMSANRANILIALLAALILIFGTYAVTGYFVADPDMDDVEITTFADTGMDICTEDGKPVIILFSTTWCPHCGHIRETFDSVAREYLDKGLIAARHWELDTKDDTLTPGVEGSIPVGDLETFRVVSGGPIPAYSMGCKYIRVGNGHGTGPDGLAAEEAEFRAVIERLIAENQ